MTVAATAVRQTIKTPRLLAVTPSAGFPLPPLPLADDAPLRTDRPWPLNEGDIDLPTESPPEPEPCASLDAPFYIGCVTAEQRGIPGSLTLEVLLAVDGASLEIGPFRLKPDYALRLLRLLGIAKAILDKSPPRPRTMPRPESGRGIVGWDLAEGLVEGETRP